EEFISSDDYALRKIGDGTSIFVKYYILPDFFVNEVYRIRHLPGAKKGISAATITGFNVGVLEGLSEKTLNATLIAFQFITSKQTQKKYFLRHQLVTGIMSLYDDEDICSITDCDLFKNFQPIGRPINATDNFYEYSEKFKKYINEFLYDHTKNVSAEETLKSIDDITRIYQINIDTEYSYIGLIISIIIFSLIGIMVASLIFLFMENFNPFFEYLPLDLWVLVVFGSVVMLCSIFTKFGEGLLDFLYFLCGYKIDNIYVEDGKNFEACNMESIFVTSISNYGLSYGIRLVFGLLQKRNIRESFINKVNKGFINNESMNNSKIKSSQFNDTSCITGNDTNYSAHTYTNNTESNNSNNKNETQSVKTSILSKIIDYHYTT
ncbi:hypothetical protein PIROE2DRAFT_4400, partial [Piromyces sp. E2]